MGGDSFGRRRGMEREQERTVVEVLAGIWLKYILAVYENGIIKPITTYN